MSVCGMNDERLAITRVAGVPIVETYPKLALGSALAAQDDRFSHRSAPFEEPRGQHAATPSRHETCQEDELLGADSMVLDR
jgi:hypothetical protein